MLKNCAKYKIKGTVICSVEENNNISCTLNVLKDSKSKLKLKFINDIKHISRFHNISIEVNGIVTKIGSLYQLKYDLGSILPTTDIKNNNEDLRILEEKKCEKN